MDLNNRVAIFTTTKYQSADEWRAVCAIETAQEAQRLGYPLVVIDGGSPQEFIDTLKSLEAIVLPETQDGPPGLGKGRRQGLQEVIDRWNPDVAFWTEPEKTSMIGFLGNITIPITRGRACMVSPWRKDRSSYPPEQIASEEFGNICFEIATGCRLDAYCGPVALNRTVFDPFLRYNSDGSRTDLWDAMIIPRIEIIATRDPAEVQNVEVDYIHPPRQTKAEAGVPQIIIKRIDQLKSLVPMFFAEAEKFGLPRR